MIRGIVFGTAAVLMLLVSGPARGAHTEDGVSPDLLVRFGCLEVDVVIELAHVYETRGQKKFDDVAALYVENRECVYILGGYPAYIDRVVQKTNYKFKGKDTYVVEAHFWGTPPGKTFYLLYYGELPARAHRSAA